MRLLLLWAVLAGLLFLIDGGRMSGLFFIAMTCFALFLRAAVIYERSHDGNH